MRKRVARDLADQCTYVVGLLNELPVRPLNVHQRWPPTIATTTATVYTERTGTSAGGTIG